MAVNLQRLPDFIMEQDICGKLFTIPGADQSVLRKEMERGFIHYLGEVPLGGSDTYADSPILIPENRLPELHQLTAVLANALDKIVRNYANDKRIRAIYDLDEELNAILTEAADIPYEIGAYRPDFLQAENGELKLCEIGARFPLNGWMISYYMEQVVFDFSFWNKEIPLQILRDMPEQFARLFDADKILTLVMESEKGSEIHWLLDLFRKKGFRVETCRPDELQYNENSVILNGQPVEQFILEMDRTELKKFKPEVLKHIIRHCRYINDVRTLILVHDKRVLAVLYDEAIMRDYLSQTDYDFLRAYLVPAFALNDENLRNKLLQEQNGWVLKESSGGRGEGMYVGHECESENWKEVLTENWKSYMVQEYVKQYTYSVPTGKSTESMHLVGMLLCLNKTLCGPGIFRGSANAVINVHQGRGLIFPVLTGSFSQ